MFVWRSAARFPSSIDAAARIQSTGCHVLGALNTPKNTIERIATKPPAFDATDRKAVTGVGAPS